MVVVMVVLFGRSFGLESRWPLAGIFKFLFYLARCISLQWRLTPCSISPLSMQNAGMTSGLLKSPPGDPGSRLSGSW